MVVTSIAAIRPTLLSSTHNDAKVVASPQPVIAHLLAAMGTPKGVPDTLTQYDSLIQLLSVKSHHTKIKVVKERKENERFIFKDLKQCMRKLEGLLKVLENDWLWLVIFKFRYHTN